MRIRVVHMVAMVMMLLLLLLPSFSTAFYERGSHVIMLDSHSKLKALRSSNYLWLVGQWRDGKGIRRGRGALGAGSWRVPRLRGQWRSGREREREREGKRCPNVELE